MHADQNISPVVSKEERLAALSLALKDLREEAIKGRAASGIEQIWR